jgi:DNA-binding transcriptional regulator GbsR (MarR family)
VQGNRSGCRWENITGEPLALLIPRDSPAFLNLRKSASSADELSPFVTLNFEPVPSTITPETTLNAFQRECVELFVSLAQILSIPRSYGEIFGLIFSTETPLCLDDVSTRLRLSRGAASQGLRWLRNIGALQRVYVEGDRREHFSAETSLRKLASGFLREKIEPHLSSSTERLETLKSVATTLPDPEQPFATTRHAQLQQWQGVIKSMLPLLSKLVG